MDWSIEPRSENDTGLKKTIRPVDLGIDMDRFYDVVKLDFFFIYFIIFKFFSDLFNWIGQISQTNELVA